MRFCPSCHAVCEDDQKFCSNCGKILRPVSSGNPEPAVTPRPAANTPPQQENVIYTDVMPRSIPAAIILSIVTCGIYGLYWMYKLNNEINEMAEDTQSPEGLMVILLSIITCGIYGLYWNYQMGRKCDYITGRDASSSILFLVLALFGLSIVSFALMQDTINKALS